MRRYVILLGCVLCFFSLALRSEEASYSYKVSLDQEKNVYMVSITESFQSANECQIAYTGTTISQRSVTGDRRVLAPPITKSQTSKVVTSTFSGYTDFTAQVVCGEIKNKSK